MIDLEDWTPFVSHFSGITLLDFIFMSELVIGRCESHSDLASVHHLSMTRQRIRRHAGQLIVGDITERDSG
jgi:hypothetical protein